ncbi:MAG TPA: YceI family protein [Longimicrobiales bacterium]|nr:YceI family protein [Longimicrobiales bacterium]
MSSYSIRRGAADAAPRSVFRSTAASTAVVLALSAAGLGAQSIERIEPLPGSAVTLSGRTSLGPWRCSVGGGYALLNRAAADPLTRLVVHLPVAGIRCSSRGMERDLRAALRWERNPDIVARSVRVRSASDEVLQAEATLEVAGVSHPISASVRWDATDPRRVRISGSLPLRMSDFDVDPPRAVLGLVRVRDQVVVEYDVFVPASTASIPLATNATALAERAP